jgi:cob(I)alamin adenosyltransferase
LASDIKGTIMTNISTKRGDGGKTSLVGGVRISKSDLRVETYGTIDELNSVIGFARSICEDAEVCEVVKVIQHELFTIISSLATPANGTIKATPITTEMLDTLTAHVHRIEKTDGILLDWSLPGEHNVSAAFDVARTVCRRAERLIVRLSESGIDIDPNILPYINRLSDLLWLFGRLIELRGGVDARRDKLKQSG